MTYEAVLLFGVLFIVAYPIVTLARWTFPMSGTQRTTLQAALFVAMGLYFAYQWSRTGQTLAMKSWHLRLLDESGRPPGLATATLRYLLAWHLLVPGAVWVAIFGSHGLVDALACAAGLALLLVPAMVDAKGRLLHDRLTSTRIVREG